MIKRGILGILILLAILRAILFTSKGISLWKINQERINLAEALGVNIDDYHPDSFPIDFFVDALKPGLDYSDVHKIVIGYEMVFLCDKKCEFYYYFSADDEEAMRFLLCYDNNGKVDDITTEDNNSRYLDHYVRECTPGRFGISQH